MQTGFAFILAVATCGQAEQGSVETEASIEIELAVELLGVEDARVSNGAYQVLWKAGRAAEVAVAKATESKNPAVALRAKLLHENFSYGIFHDTPADVLDLIYGFRNGDESTKRRIVNQLYRQKKPHVTWRLLRAGDFSNEFILSNYSQLVRDYLPDLIRDGRVDDVDELLFSKATLEQHYREGVRDYAAYLFHRGEVGGISHPRLVSPMSKSEIRLFGYLSMMHGDLNAAATRAEQAGCDDLKAAILNRKRDWDALRKSDFCPGDPNSMERLGFEATLARLAGDDETFKMKLSETKALADKSRLQLRDKSFSLAFQYAEVLMINGQWPEAIKVLQSGRVDFAFEVLVKQNRVAEAFAVYGFDLAKDSIDDWLSHRANDDERVVMGLQIAQVLYKLGEKRKATALLDAIATLDAGNRANVLFRLASTEYKVGLTDRAMHHAAEGLKANEKESHRYFGPTFGQQRLQLVRSVLAELRAARPDDDALSLIKSLHGLFLPKLVPDASANELDALRRHCEKQISAGTGQPQKHLALLGELCAMHGQTQQAVEYLIQPAKSHAYGLSSMRIADLALVAKDWTRAAEFYRSAWETSRQIVGPAALYLHGYALKRAGHGTQAAEIMLTASILPLGDVNVRNRLAMALHERGLKAEALEQWKMIAKLGPYNAWSGTQAGALMRTSQRLGDHFAKSDPAQAADHWQRMMLYMLKSNYNIREPIGYAHMMLLIHRSRALGLFKIAKFDEAVREVWLCHAAGPGDTKAVIEFVPWLEKAGRQDDADKLFAQTYSVIEKMCKFPDARNFHNALAWMCAKCNRRLDDALVHARRAVELEGDKVAYLDTLALVQFLRGEKDEAITLIKKCIELEPNDAHFKQQLERFQKE
jgi:tetratricopeptide (TPR) repeat protein